MTGNSLKDNKNLDKISKRKYVICSLCGRKIDINAAFLVFSGKKKAYYCSKEEYEGGQAYVENQTRYYAALEHDVRDIVGSGGGIFNFDLYNELRNVWLRYAKIEDICELIHKNRDEYFEIIDYKGIEEIDGRLKYLSAIIMRNIVQYNKEAMLKNISAIELNSDIDYSMYTPKMSARKGMRRSLSDLEDNYEPKK